MESCAIHAIPIAGRLGAVGRAYRLSLGSQVTSLVDLLGCRAWRKLRRAYIAQCAVGLSLITV